MKYSILSLCVLGCLAQQSWALGLKDSPIQHVTVYPNGALVERSIPVRAGERLIELVGLPANFDVSAIKVQGQNVDVTAVTSVDSALDKPAGRESTALKNEIKQLEADIAKVNARIQAAELQNKFLGNITQGSASTVRQQASDAYLTISTASQEKKQLEQRLAELNQDLNQIGDHRFNQRTLQLHVNAPSSGAIQIGYLVPYATWRPSYKAELNSATQQVTLTRMAMIAQKTGEDWDNVQLTLSTSSPQGNIEQVQPNPWWVNYYERRDEPMYAPEPVAIEAAPIADSAGTEMRRAQAPSFPQFEQVQQTYSTQFTTTTRASIPSSKQQISLPLDQQSYAAKLSTWVIPQQRQAAYLTAEIPRVTGDWPSGEVKIYRDGDYIGHRQWQNPTADQMHFNFGEDEQVLVKVLNDERNQDQTGGFSKSVVEVLTKQYQIQNLHQQAIDLLVFESVPKSQNDALKVSHQFSENPVATQWQGQDNIYQWRPQLAPNQTWQLNIQYQFKYPKDGYATGF